MIEIKGNNGIISILKIALLIGFVVVVLKGVGRSQKSPYLSNKEACEIKKERLIHGIVEKNTWSRGAFISILHNEKMYSWRCKSKVRDIIKPGDLIYKPSGTYNTYIYKNADPDSMIFISCEYDCNYWLERYKEEQKKKQTSKTNN